MKCKNFYVSIKNTCKESFLWNNETVKSEYAEVDHYLCGGFVTSE